MRLVRTVRRPKGARPSPERAPSRVHEPRFDRGHTRRSSEKSIHAAIEQRAWVRAARAAEQLYGPEIFGFLSRVLSGGFAARAAYMGWANGLRPLVRKLRSSSSLRAEMYALARRQTAVQRQHRRPPAELGTAAPDIPTFEATALPAPPEMPPMGPFRMGARVRPEVLRNALPPDDLEILILRVDRRFSWRDVAITSLPWRTREDGAIDEEADRLRARFREVKRALLRAAQRSGRTPGE